MPRSVPAFIETSPVMLLSVTTPRAFAPVRCKMLSVPAFIVALPLTVLGSIVRMLVPVTAVIAIVPPTVESVMWALLSTAAIMVMVEPAATMSNARVLSPTVLTPPLYASMEMAPPIRLGVNTLPELR